MTIVEQANEMIYQGRVRHAVEFLRDAGVRGDASAWVELAYLYLAGSAVPRDLSLVREFFRPRWRSWRPESEDDSFVADRQWHGRAA
jgi:TPR repeat protein